MAEIRRNSCYIIRKEVKTNSNNPERSTFYMYYNEYDNKWVYSPKDATHYPILNWCRAISLTLNKHGSNSRVIKYIVEEKEEENFED